MNKIKLGDILAIQHGFAFKSQNYVDDSNYALVTLANISSTNNFQYNKANMTFYGADFPKEYILKENDLIMPLTEQSVGLFGNTAFVPFTNNITFVLNQRVGKVIPKEEKTTKYYLHYLLSCEYVKKQLEYRASGTRQRNISPKDIYDVEVFIPEYNIQKKIGSLLYNIEQKININNKISDELEDMAKTIYNYWFLQFEFPNEEGKPYKSSGGKIVWNEELKREIPEGWEVIALKNNIQIIKGISYTSKNINAYEGIPMINLASINIKREYNPNQLKYFRGSYNINKEVSAFDMLIACTDLTRNAEIIGSPILVPNDNKKYIYSMDLAKIEVINSKIIPLYLYMTLRTDFFHKYIKGFASGTNVLHLDTRGIEYYKIYIPDKKLQRKFADILHNIHCKQSNIMKENQELTSLRDFLLPLLMNGQVGFKENKAEG